MGIFRPLVRPVCLMSLLLLALPAAASETPVGCDNGPITSACICTDPQTDTIQTYTSGYCYNGFWHNTDWTTFVIWEDGFDDGVPMGDKYFEYGDDEGDFVPVSYEYRSPPNSMRALYQTGEVSAGGFKKSFGRTPDSYIGRHAARPTEDFREIYWRFYLKMQAGWEGAPAKVCRATIMANSNWAQAMIAHLWSGNTQPSLVMDPASGIDANGNLVTTRYNDFDHLMWLGYVAGPEPIFATDQSGRWRCVEGHVRLDDPGQNNGIFEFWIDGVRQARRTNYAWVKTWNQYGINSLFFANYWNSGSVKTQERYFDDLVIATERIGPADYQPLTPPRQLRIVESKTR